MTDRSSDIVRRRLRISGQVQGVGFRPFVYRLAVEMRLVGWVNNDSRGVTVELQGTVRVLDELVRRLRSELPPLAKIAHLEQSDMALAEGETKFEIRPSDAGELADAQVTVDTAVCEDCLREMHDPRDPRYRYPFINCTNCGPRYTIVRSIPYDRPNTTMSFFPMCALCSGEYHDPASRRFHAQPIACPKCGPHVWLVDSRGKEIAEADPIERAAQMLLDGRILAIKGLGGFHLACRADEDHVVRRLRARKRRDAKPFAVMVATIDRVGDYCEMTPEAKALLESPIRPIVLLPALSPCPVASSVATGLDTLGIMLPYTPLHYLLFAHKDLPPVPLVMTSGNFSDEPLVKDNESAVAHLGRIADALLVHDRPIERRLDDSVVQMHYDGRPSVLRRGRGYAPSPIELSVGGSEGAAVLAVGGELKNTVCLYRGGKAVLGEHVGDLKDGRVYRHFIDTINHLEALFEVRPEVIAADLHPQYLSSEYALRRHRGELEGKPAVPIVRVQHHHAHIVACMAENGRSEPVIGLACDGVGLGDDGAVWGCEILRAELGSYTRLGHLRYTPLLGGDAAAVDTSRPALAALWDTFGHEIAEMPAARQLAGGQEPLDVAIQMLDAGVNCPPSSSLGRWFDAMAGLSGLAMANEFEAQAPMKLEAAIESGVENAYDYRLIFPASTESAGWRGDQASARRYEGPESAGLHEGPGPAAAPFQIDLRPMVREIVAEVQAGYNPGVMAARFHNTVAAFLLAAAEQAREMTAINVVALSGGCFANRYLRGRLAALLRRQGFEVLVHHTIPCNDGCVSLGQAIVAAASLGKRG